ncbi:MAG: glycosyltransferase family 41 protein [Bradyrhizobium sp.]|uniref:tetratricopeptide repeat protein n=1 Tax=Bradyrhizobium sp. TaxID=376 RepID=UPI0012108E42|nr:glycosyltransferase family 41 protein [Bradyrhizobium sp.]THD70670.1 MAG: glycosyltransferase family 41 protein [Bradyrhizobium sp.]
MNSNFGIPLQPFERAVSLHDSGRLSEAEQLYQMVLLGDDRHFDALCRFGLVRLQQQRFADAEGLIRRAIKVDKRSAEAHQLLGSALTGLGRLEEAVRSYSKAVAIRPRFAEARNNLGYALQVLGRHDEAILHYKKAIAARADYPEAYNNLGNALHLLERSDEAIIHYEKAIAIRPDYAEAYWNLGNALSAVGRLDDAIGFYQKAIAIKPRYHEAFNSLGNAYSNLGKFDEAVLQYNKALALNPDYVEARLNLGDALGSLDQHEAALAAYDAVLVLKAGDANALTKRGQALRRLNRDEEALASYEAALNFDPSCDAAFDGLAGAALASCDWTRTARLWREVPAHVASGKQFDAFRFLGYSSDPALQLECARRFIAQEVTVRRPPFWTGERWKNERIKIAYVSCGFHKHPTAYLTAELLEIHDRSRFEIIGVSLGPDDGSEIRARLIRAFDQFHDVQPNTDQEAAQLLHDLRVDIAVDRSGYTTNARPGIFVARPAPIQVNYIGFPGTLGAKFYDYILADATVLPFDRQPFYTERIVHLPNSYLVNDTKRSVSTRTPTRQESGLPEQGFVFCCFNNTYKITPPVFDVWMRLLAQVEGSVLWLLSDRESAEANLLREAAARGIDPARLVFARRVPLEDHLARHRLADLFLDTLPYNAHTTAADALSMGLPVVSCLGESFAGRVAASLLRAVGMLDLVTSSLGEYEDLILRIAREPAMLQELRDRLQRNKVSWPLFDSDLYRRNIESAYVRMWEAWQRGEAPVSFAVKPDVSAQSSKSPLPQP